MCQKKYYYIFINKKRDLFYFLKYGRSFKKEREKWLKENLN